MALATFVPQPAAAQESAALLVIVRAGDDGRALHNAQVAFKEFQAGGLTNEAGEYRRTGLLPGIVMVEVSSIGYATIRTAVALERGVTEVIEVRLPLEPVEQASIEVRSRRGGTRALQEYYSRVERRGGGHFITREDIEEQGPRQFSDLLRSVPNMRLDCSNWQHCTVTTRSAPVTGVTNDCPIQMYVNGVFQPHSNINLLNPDHIEGVEVYPHARGAPARYTMRKQSRCGLILVWLRRGP